MVDIEIGELRKFGCVSTSSASCRGTGPPLFDPSAAGSEWSGSDAHCQGDAGVTRSCLTPSQERSHGKEPQMPELMVDFITSLDGYGAADGWPGWWGLEGPEASLVGETTGG